MKMENYLIGLSEISDLERLKDFFLSEASSFGATPCCRLSPDVW
jgi:hypothetical protein